MSFSTPVWTNVTTLKGAFLSQFHKVLNKCFFFFSKISKFYIDSPEVFFDGGAFPPKNGGL